jgi:primary-amine oxidase
VGFKLRPEGFFDRSPVLDVPASAGGSSPAGSCRSDGDPGGHCHG